MKRYYVMYVYKHIYTSICTLTHMYPYIIKDNLDQLAQSGTSKSSSIFKFYLLPPAYLLVAVFYTTESLTSGLEPHYF